MVKKHIDEKAEELANRTKAGQMKNETATQGANIQELEQQTQAMIMEKERQRVILNGLWRGYYDKSVVMDQLGGASAAIGSIKPAKLPRAHKQDQAIKELDEWLAKATVYAIGISKHA